MCVPGVAKPGAVSGLTRLRKTLPAMFAVPVTLMQIGRWVEIEVEPVDAGRSLNEVAGDVGRVDVLIAARRQQSFVGEQCRMARRGGRARRRTGVEDAGRLVVDAHSTPADKSMEPSIRPKLTIESSPRPPVTTKPEIPPTVVEEAVVDERVCGPADEPNCIGGLVAVSGRSARAEAADDRGARSRRRR